METQKRDTVNIVFPRLAFRGEERKREAARRREIFARVTRRMERKKDGTSKGGPG